MCIVRGAPERGAFTDTIERLNAALADHYRVERELGAGGMATVYLAEDLRHHRQVALKVLKPEIAATLGAGRFAREIEVAARLQHPNILPLLDSGEAGGFFFYVMPYVEGESLRDRLARGGELPIPDAVRILVEVADALSHAHAHGVVHRDIKPDNVMLSGRHALVTDFGVAKAVTAATGYQLLTSTGVALGTPTYMAPEQATADPHQDHRVDIYALGVMAYELLAGRAPYAATTAQEMLAAHLTAEPEPLEKYRPATPRALAGIIAKCLAKKPADRWQTANEVLDHLEPLVTPSGGTTPRQTAPAEVEKMRRRFSLAVTGAGLVAVAAMGVLAYQLMRTKPLNITVSNLTQVTNDPGIEYQQAISPDGNEVAYVASRIYASRLFVRSVGNLAGGASVRLSDSTLGSAWLPSWTPDGLSVRFLGCGGGFGVTCTWGQVGRLGGVARALTLPPLARVAWSPDGVRMAFTRKDTILTTTLNDSAAHRLTVNPGANMHSLTWSPDGKLLAYVDGNALWRVLGNVATSSIWVVRADGGESHQVTTGDCLNVSPAWLDPKHLLFVSDRDGPRGVYVVGVAPSGPTGAPRLIPGVADPHSISYSTGSRKLAWAKLTLRQNIRSYPLDRVAPVSVRDGHLVTSGDQVIEDHDVSRDGRWIVFDANRRGKMDLYRMSLAGGPFEPLTESPQNYEGPRWSPDARQIAFYSVVGAARTELMIVSGSGGTAVPLTRVPGLYWQEAWSPNGLEIAFDFVPAGSYTPRIFVLRRDSVGGAWREPTQLSPASCGLSEWAPDGRSIACQHGVDLSMLAGRDGRLLRDHLLTANRLAYESGNLRFSGDGRVIFIEAVHQDGRRGMWAVPVRGGPARLVVAFDDPALLSMGSVSAGRDRLYLTVSDYESDIWVATLNY